MPTTPRAWAVLVAALLLGAPLAARSADVAWPGSEKASDPTSASASAAYFAAHSAARAANALLEAKGDCVGIIASLTVDAATSAAAAAAAAGVGRWEVLMEKRDSAGGVGWGSSRPKDASAGAQMPRDRARSLDWRARLRAACPPASPLPPSSSSHRWRIRSVRRDVGSRRGGRPGRVVRAGGLRTMAIFLVFLLLRVSAITGWKAGG